MKAFKKLKNKKFSTWILATNPAEEILYRVQLNKVVRGVYLPRVGEIPAGELAELINNGSTKKGSFEISLLSEAACLARNLRAKSLGRARRFSHLHFLVPLFSLGAVGNFFAFFPLSLPETKPDFEVKDTKSGALFESGKELGMPLLLSKELNVATKKQAFERVKIRSTKPPLTRIRKKDEERIWSDFVAGRWRRAKEKVDKLYGEPRIWLSSTFKKKAAEMYFAFCRQARDEKDFHQALRDCRRAEKIGGHIEAKQVLEILARQARNRYLEGYILEQTDKSAAKERYLEAMKRLPSFDPLYLKAKAKIAMIEGG